MCVIIFHSRAQTKSCPRQTFALERNHTWDFLQHSGNGVKTLCFGEGSENSRFFEQTLAIAFFKPSTLLAILKDTKAQNYLNYAESSEKNVDFSSGFSTF